MAGNSGLNFLKSSVLDPVSNGLSNLISGGTWKQSGSEIAAQNFNASEAQKTRDFEKEMSSTAYQRAVEDIEQAGLNPNMIYGSGGTPASTPTSSSAAAGSGRRAAVQGDMNVIGQVSGLLNAVTNARALDHQIDKKSTNITTQRLYNSVGELVQTLVKTTK